MYVYILTQANYIQIKIQVTKASGEKMRSLENVSDKVL
jgi:hypothetical protein